MTDDMHNYDCISKTCATMTPRHSLPSNHPLENKNGPIPMWVLIKEGSAGVTRAWVVLDRM